MNGDLETIGSSDRKKVIIIASVSAVVLAGAVTAVVLFLRSRAAIDEPGTNVPPVETDVNAPSVNVNQPSGAATEVPLDGSVTDAMREKSARDVAAYLAANPPPLDRPEVEVGVEKLMTAEEKARIGFRPEQSISYMYVQSEEEGSAPVMVITSLPAEIPDADHDGLADEDEPKYGTDPAKFDTDGDQVSDGDEVKYYKTDPTKADTNGDGTPDARTK